MELEWESFGQGSEKETAGGWMRRRESWMERRQRYGRWENVQEREREREREKVGRTLLGMAMENPRER